MQAIILAAGMGKRLGDLTMNNTKCMVEVNGIALIDRILTQLSHFNLSKVVLVVGYEGEKLMAHVGSEYNGLPVVYVENPIYNKTNNIYSLFLAKDYLLAEDSILIESDLIIEESIIKKVLEHDSNTLAVVAQHENWMDGTVVTLDRNNDIVNIIPPKAFNFKDKSDYYKTVNIFKFSRDFSTQYYVPFLSAYCQAIGHNEYYEQVLRVITMIDQFKFKALVLNEEKWYEIDDVQDLDIAETIFSNQENKLEKYAGKYGGYWRYPKLTDFCYLVNPFFPSAKMKEELKSNFDALLESYPSGRKVNLQLASKCFHVKHNYLCVGNGAAELINLLMTNLTGKTGIIFPTFEEYSNRLSSEEIVSFTPNNESYSYNADEIVQFYQDKNISSLLLVNPDNPSGNYIVHDELLKLCAWAYDKKIRLVIDESFLDFAEGSPNVTLLKDSTLEQFPNLIVIKSISKSYGIPGLRLGILASSDEQLIIRINKEISIWNINSFAEYFMQIFNKYEDEYYVACNKLIIERVRFYNELKAVPFLRVIPSASNYFLCEVKKQFTSTEIAFILLDKHNILIKDCKSKQGINGKDFIRLAIRNREDNQKLVNALLLLK